MPQAKLGEATTQQSLDCSFNTYLPLTWLGKPNVSRAALIISHILLPKWNMLRGIDKHITGGYSTTTLSAASQSGSDAASPSKQCGSVSKQAPSGTPTSSECLTRLVIAVSMLSPRFAEVMCHPANPCSPTVATPQGRKRHTIKSQTKPSPRTPIVEDIQDKAHEERSQASAKQRLSRLPGHSTPHGSP